MIYTIALALIIFGILLIIISPMPHMESGYGWGWAAFIGGIVLAILNFLRTPL
jgi:uncharacterized membrane protein HdeD (DUF308 family)